LKRQLWVTPEIANVLDGNKPSTGFPHVTADAIVTRIVAGHSVNVTSRREKTGTTFKRFSEAEGVWSVIFPKPPPGFRLLGRFVEKDLFVGLNLQSRDDLGGSRYAAEISRTAEAWNALIPAVPYIDDGDVSAFLSEPYYDADNET
jgi:hypothetical protein